MSDVSVASILSAFDDYPRFADGRIDYHNAPVAAVVNVLVECEGRLLLLKRSDAVHTYKGKWMVVAGYLDEVVSPEVKAREELAEEIGVADVRTLTTHDPIEFTDEDLDATFIVFPVRVVLKKRPDIALDEEHTRYEWVSYDDVSGYDVVPSLPEVLEHVR